MGELELKIIDILNGYLWGRVDYEWGQPIAVIEDKEYAANAIVQLFDEYKNA